MDFLSTQFLSALMAIVVIDLVLAGDNAIVIALAARNVPVHLSKREIFFGAMFFQIPALSLAVSAMFVLLMSGLILYETSNLIHGGETNYIMATVTLYVSIFNLFTSLLHLLGAASGDD